MEQRERNANGTFTKGHPSIEGARRKKGTLNKLTADIRAGAISGFARHGSNGRGEGGFAGFCFYLAKKHPKAAARIVEKLLPLNVNATGLSNPSISTVNVISVPAGRFLSKEDMDRLQQPQLTIDAVPQPVHLEEPARCEEPAADDFENMPIEELMRRAGVTDVDSR